MDIDTLMTCKAIHQLLCLVERLLETKRVSPCKKRRVCICIEVAERMTERHCKTILFVAPLHWTLASLPLHRVRLDPVNRSEAHLVELALLGHAFHCKSKLVTVLDPFDAEIKPCPIVTHVCVWQPVP